jgi:hypothetical protein
MRLNVNKGKIRRDSSSIQALSEVLMAPSIQPAVVVIQCRSVPLRAANHTAHATADSRRLFSIENARFSKKQASF